MSNKPIAQVKNGRGLSVSIFANATSEGKTYYNTPGVENRYFDKKTDEWKSTFRLSESDFLEASELLKDAARTLRELRAESGAAANDQSQPTNEVA